MAVAARVDIASRRNEARTITIRFVGVDWSAATFRQQVRLSGDTPGAPLLNLATVTSATAEGLRMAGVTIENGIPVTTVRLRYNLTTMRDTIPFAGEVGDDARFSHAIQVDGITRLYGDWWAVASVIDSDTAPTNRPFGYDGGTRAPAVASAVGLTFAGEDVIRVVIDGAEIIQPLVAQALAASLTAEQQAAIATAKSLIAQLAMTDAGGYLAAIQQLTSGSPTTAQLSLQATSRATLALITDATAGRQAYLGEEGCEGVFVFRTGDQSARVTADPFKIEVVAPTSAPTGSAGAWVRARQTYYNVTWFGAKGDGRKVGGVWVGTDNTVAIQRAVDYVTARGGGTIFFPDGVYLVSGPIQADAESPAQILMPRISLAPVGGMTIELLGETAPDAQGQTSGAIIQSTLTAADGQGRGALIGGSAGGQRGATWINWVARKMTFRLPQNSQLRCVDARFFQSTHVEQVRIDVVDYIINSGGFSVLSVAYPQHENNIGFQGPLNDIPSWNNYYGMSVLGYRYGWIPGELMGGTNVSIAACYGPIVLQTYRHASSFGRILVTNSPHTVIVTGAGETHIAMIDIEHNTAAGSGPAWVEPHLGDIFDPGNLWRGSVNIHMHDVEIPLIVNGAANLEYTVDQLPDDANVTFFRAYPGFQNLVDRHSLEENRPRNGRVPWKSNVVDQASPTGILSGESTVTINGNPDGRVVQTSHRTDGGNIARGRFVISTGRDGVVTDHWAVDSLGNLIKLQPWVTAATDAAAGAAGVASNAFYKRSDGSVWVKS